MPSPMSQKHGSKNLMMGTWVGVYSAKVPACEGGMDSTWYMLDDSPQPDVFLRMKDHSGGKSWLSGKYLQGAPELVIEVCLSSEGYDLNAKKALYAAAGVVEFAAVLALNRDVKWMYLENGVYRDLKPDADGILRSRTFPGLWLDPVAVVSDDLNRVLEVLARGMKSPEFLEFAARNQPA